MPFYPEWNPTVCGSYDVAEKWILDNLGKGPAGSSLHIINPVVGFWPGNLEWASPSKQSRQQLHKIVAQQKHALREFEPFITLRLLYQSHIKNSERKTDSAQIERV